MNSLHKYLFLLSSCTTIASGLHSSENMSTIPDISSNNKNAQWNRKYTSNLKKSITDNILPYLYIKKPRTNLIH